MTRGITTVRAGKAPGILMTDAEASRYYLDQGAQLVAVGVDAMLLVQAARALASAFKSGTPGAVPGSSA